MVADAEITSTTHAAFAPEVWAADTHDAMQFLEVLSKLVNTKFEDEMSVGRILHIPHRSNLTTQVKSEGVSNTIVFEAITQTNQDITVSTYEYAAVLLNAVVQAQSAYDDRQALANAMGYALMRGMEVSIAALFQSFSQVVGSLGASIDMALLLRAWQYLADAGFATDASWIFSPAMATDIFSTDKLTSKDFVTTSGIERAMIPPILSFPAYTSNLIRSPATGQHEGALLHKPSIILIRQVEPTPKSAYLIRYNADGLLMYDYYAVVEAEQPAETPGSESLSDTGAVLIRGA
jgi:hypothetical protein